MIDSMLSRTSLHLSQSARDRQIRHHDEYDIIRVPDLENTSSFDEHSVLIVSNSATDLYDRDVGLVQSRRMLEPAHDLISYVRNGLDALATISQRALFFDNVLVNHSACEIIVLCNIPSQKSFIIPHVLICLKPRIKHEDLSMLCRIHGSSVNI